MPGTKRSSKVLSDDDDDFIPRKKVENKPQPPPKPEPVNEESSTSSHDLELDVEEQNENSDNQKDVEKFDDKPVVPTVQSNTSTTRRHSSVPLGFPTSKINIPSPHVSRVGLSRKSLPAKSLHPNLISRVHPD